MALKPPRPVLHSAAFLTIGLCLHFGFIATFEAVVESRTVDWRQERHFEAFEGDIRVLVLGASHSRGGFDIRLTEDAFVYAFPGETYPSIYYRLEHALKRHSEVEHVIAPVGAYYFQLREDIYPDMWIGFGELPRYDKYGDGYGYFKNYLRRVAFPYAGMSQRTWDMINGVFEQENKGEMTRGFQPSFNRLDQLFSTEELAAKAEDIVALHYTGQADSLHAYYLERIAALCAERDIRLTLVDWPASRAYIRLAEGRFDPAVQEAAIEAARAHLPIDVVDIRETFADRPELFGNPDHLNAEGAYVSTRLILEQAGLPIRDEVTAPVPPPARLH